MACAIELDYWDLATTKERQAWHALQDTWAAVPDSAREHYRATADAINRMGIAQGEAQLLLAKITPSLAGADARTARLTTLMPLALGIVLYQQPSALMLYWLTSNLLQLAQRWWLGKRYA